MESESEGDIDRLSESELDGQMDGQLFTAKC